MSACPRSRTTSPSPRTSTVGKKIDAEGVELNVAVETLGERVDHQPPECRRAGSAAGDDRQRHQHAAAGDRDPTGDSPCPAGRSCYFSGACWAMSRTSAAGRITGSRPSPSLPLIIENMPDPAALDRSHRQQTDHLAGRCERRRSHATGAAGLDHVERARLLDDRANRLERGGGRPSTDTAQPGEHHDRIEKRRLPLVCQVDRDERLLRLRRGAQEGQVEVLVAQNDPRGQLLAVRQAQLDVARLAAELHPLLPAAAPAHHLVHHRARIQRAQRKHRQPARDRSPSQRSRPTHPWTASRVRRPTPAS